MRTFSTLCAIMVGMLVLAAIAACDAPPAGDTPSDTAGATGGDAAPGDTGAPDPGAPDTAPPDTAPPDTAPPDTAPPDTAPPAPLPTCANVRAPALAACVVPAGSEAGAPEWIADGTTTAVAGVVVEAGTGAAPDECFERGPGFGASHGATAEEWAAARWFRVEDAGGARWTVGLLLGEHTPALAPGEAVLVSSWFRHEPFDASPGHLAVTRPGGALVAWFGTAGRADELEPPAGVALARGPAVCEQAEHCGAWEGYELAITLPGEAPTTVPYGGTATLGAWRVVHGGLLLQTTTETACADWFVGHAAVALVPLPTAPPAWEPRPQAPWPGPCATAKRHADGVAFESWTYGYDAAGHVVREEWDATADGVVETLVTRTYDDAGRLTSVQVEGFDEEHAAASDRYVWIYEGDRLVREEHEDAAGVLLRRVTYTHDAAGRLVTKELDHGADGTVDARWTYTNDDAGRRTSEEWDQDADGAPESRSEWTYDAEGREAGERHDEDADGRPERVVTHTWYAAGHALRTDEDRGAGFCCFGQGSCMTDSCAADGVVDRRTLRLEALDGRSLLALYDGAAERDPMRPVDPPDGEPDGRDEWVWRDSERLLRMERRDATGALRAWIDLRYDIHGDLVERTSENSGHPASQRFVYSRDDAGNLLEEAFHTPASDAAPALRTTHEYDCWR